MPAEGTRIGTAEMVLWTGTIVMLLILVLCALFWSVDKRLLNEASLWAKPMKFAISLSLHMATLALIVAVMSDGARTGGLIAATAAACALASLGEITYIVVQAARGQASHFNMATPFTRGMYTAMAVGAVILTVAAAIIGLVAATDRQAEIAPALRHALALGLVGGTILTLVTAFTIGSRLSPHVPAEPAGGARMALTGWSLRVGDIRVSHFLATHMMQVVPLAALRRRGWCRAGPGWRPSGWSRRLWSALVLVAYQQALAGRPLFG